MVHFTQSLNGKDFFIYNFLIHFQPNKLYLCCVLYNEDKVLMTNEEALPLIQIEDLNSCHMDLASIYTEFHWFSKLTHMWSDIDRLKANIHQVEKKFTIKAKILNAIQSMQGSLSGLGGDLGSAYRMPIILNNGESDSDPGNRAIVFSLIRHVKNSKSVVSLTLKWVPMSKAQRSKLQAQNDQLQLSSVSHHQPSPSNNMDLLCFSIREQIIFQQVSNMALSKGLYACYVQTCTTVDGVLSVIVPNSSPSILPYTKIRDNPHVTAEEWSWIKGHRQKITKNTASRPFQSPTVNYLDGEGEVGSDINYPSNNSSTNKPTLRQYFFGKTVMTAMNRLFDYLDVDESMRSSHRIYDGEVIDLSDDVSIILVLPPPQMLCVLLADKEPECCIKLERNDMLAIPVHSFEFFHVNAYNKALLSNFCRCLILVELMLSSAKQTLRETLDNGVMEVQQQKISDLTKNQQILEEGWRPLRWLKDILSIGRNRNEECGILFGVFAEWNLNQSPVPDSQSQSDIIPDPRLDLSIAEAGQDLLLRQRFGSRTRQVLRDKSLYEKNSSLPSSLSSSPAPPQQTQEQAKTTGQKLLSTSNLQSSNDSDLSNQSNQSILQIYAAYESGLANGTSVVITLTESTTAREVVDLVVKQLNMAVTMKGKSGPIYDNDQLKKFCLVAVIGNRERCLRDDFKPLNLQNPWRRGKLYVRVKNDVLAAIEHEYTTTNENAVPISAGPSSPCGPIEVTAPTML